jgi:ankyrin repeat protein
MLGVDSDVLCVSRSLVSPGMDGWMGGDWALGRVEERLHVAAGRGDIQGMQLALEEGSGIDEMDSNGLTALGWASFNGKMEAVGMLLSRGAQVNGRDGRGNSALIYASTESQGGVARLLVQKGADH